MDVDEQVDEGLGEEEDAEMDGQEDEDGNPPPRKRSKARSKPRKSGVDIEALTRNVVVDEAELQRLKILELQRSLSKKALKFIGIVEKSSDIIVRLLGSTHKSEVVEAIEFFRIAHEWKMELAEVRFLRLSSLHGLVLTFLSVGGNQEDGASYLAERQQPDLGGRKGDQRYTVQGP